MYLPAHPPRTSKGQREACLSSRNRLYDTSLGRWISADPAGYIDGSNLYQIEQDNTENSTDPSGLDDQTNDVNKFLKDAGFESKDGFNFAPVQFRNNLWLGTAEPPFPPSIDLPSQIRGALMKAILIVKEKGGEAGGSITTDGPSFTVWGPVPTGRDGNAGTPLNAAIPPDNNPAFAGVKRTVFGGYHVHPRLKDIFSSGDVSSVLGPYQGNPYNFSILSDCQGAHVWALFRLKLTPPPYHLDPVQALALYAPQGIGMVVGAENETLAKNETALRNATKKTGLALYEGNINTQLRLIQT